MNFLVDLEGEVKLQRSQWDHFVNARPFSIVELGDLIRVAPGGRASVICSDLTIHPLNQGRSNSVPCPSGLSLINYRGESIAPTRGGETSDIPIVLSPRKTIVPAGPITLRWTSVSGVSNYEVIVRGGAVDWHSQVSNRELLVYPSSGPHLSPGTSYMLIVNYKDPASGAERSSREEGTPDLGFSVLTAGDSTRLLRYQEVITQSSMSAPAKTFVAASVLMALGLRNEAIDRLERLAATDPSPMVARALGALYLGQSLYRYSERWYRKAAELAKDINDTESQAVASDKLSGVYRVLGNATQAARELKMANDLYRQLGPRARSVSSQP